MSAATIERPPVKGSTSRLPSVTEIRTAARDTRLLLKLRWRFVRNTRARAFIWLGLGVFFSAIFIASQVGTLIRKYAEQGVGTAAGQFAVNYVIALSRGELGLIGASAVGSVIIVALFTPFTGSSMQSLAPAEDLAGLRPTRIHRFFDSIVTNAASAIGFLQLITLTGIGSLLTLDGGRPAGLLFMWSVWPVLVLVAVSEGWAIELVQRKYGRKVRRGIALTLATILGLAVYLDPNHGSTLFGVGDQIAATLGASASGDLSVVARSVAVVAVLIVTLFFTGMMLCRAALARPAAVVVTRTERRRWIAMSANPNIALMQVLFAQVTRSPEVRRPLFTVFFIGLPAVWFSGQANVMTTLVVAIPLAVALAFGINTFGILGPAMPWFASQPNLMKKILLFAVIIQISMTLLLSFLVWTPATLAGRVDPGDIAAVAAGTVVSTFLTARSAAHKAVNRPFLVRMGSRGDMIVPPLTAINYTIRFAMWSGQIGVITMTQDGWIQVAMVAFALTWATLRFVQLFRQWSDRDVQAFVTKQVAAA